MAYVAYPLIRAYPDRTILICGQSNASPLPIDASVAFRFIGIRHTQAGTAIAQWQKGQPIGDGIRRAYSHAGRSNPLFIVWVQGEDDSTVPLAPLYEGKLRTWATELRSDLSDPHIFIVGINAGFTAYAERATVRAAQVTVAAEWSRWHLVDPDSVTAHDGAHYTFAGYQQVGALVAQAVTAVL